ncbi:MAG: hypothetical protein ABI669_16030 [Usitatibacter sp.]
MRARDVEGAALILEALLTRHDVAEAALMLGALRAGQSDFARALTQIEKAFRLQPLQPPGARLLYANVLLDSGDAQQAEAQVRGVLALPAQSPAGEARALFRLARRLSLALSIEMLQRSVALDASNADAWNDLGNALANIALLEPARDAYRAALRADPEYHQVESNLLVTLHYDPDVDADTMFEAHRGWARRHAAGIAPLALPARAPSQRLRVGFLSPAFTPGPTAAFLAPLVKHLDAMRHELFAYNVGPEDIDARLTAAITHWRHAALDDDESLARQIAADSLDVLVDLAGHTPGGRPLVIARKPARAVIEWLDYFDTSGLDGVDIIVGDPVSTPANTAQRFTEHVVNIDPCRFCFEAPAHAPAVAPSPAAKNGYVTFGSFNRLSKMPAPVLAAWARILHGTPASRLLVKNNALADAATRENFVRAMQGHGIARDRIELRGPTPHAAMLAEYADMDIALDTFPYNGGLTTCEALWMGVPVLTILGNAMISRQSASMLAAVGMEDWIARDVDEFVRKATDFASRAGELSISRGKRREAIAASPLMDGPRFARAFAAVLDGAAR